MGAAVHAERALGAKGPHPAERGSSASSTGRVNCCPEGSIKWQQGCQDAREDESGLTHCGLLVTFAP